MEQKKILWILLSVTLFLFIVSITGVVWFYPDKVADTGGNGSSDKTDQASVDFDPVEWVRQGEDFPGLTPVISEEEEEGFSIVYGETESGETVVNLVADNGTKETENNTESSTLVNTETTEKPEPVKIVPQRSVNVAAPAPKIINVLEYWIQAGSFSSRSGAEGSSKVLSGKGFSNLITIKTVDSKDYFRVRMGPYTSKDEAEKFLGWVKEIDSYDQSYISQVYVQKSVN
jgi:cell division septation protein DedD